MHLTPTHIESYNIFRSRLSPDVHCAVPEICVLPHFLRQGAWEYFGRVNGETSRIPFFERKAARSLGELNGFYVYQEF
jgi:hypothetical protein